MRCKPPVRDIVAPSMLHSIWTLYTNLPSHELQKLLCIFGCWYTSRFLVYALKELTLKESDRIILWISTCLLKKCIFATTERPEGEWFLDDTCRHFQYLSRNWIDSTKTSVFIYKLFSWWANGAYIVQLLQLFVVSLLLMINDGLDGFLWRMGIVHLWDWLQEIGCYVGANELITSLICVWEQSCFCVSLVWKHVYIPDKPSPRSVILPWAAIIHHSVLTRSSYEMKNVAFLFLLVIYSYFHMKTVSSYLVNPILSYQAFRPGMAW